MKHSAGPGPWWGHSVRDCGFAQSLLEKGGWLGWPRKPVPGVGFRAKCMSVCNWSVLQDLKPCLLRTKSPWSSIPGCVSHRLPWAGGRTNTRTANFSTLHQTLSLTSKYLLISLHKINCSYLFCFSMILNRRMFVEGSTPICIGKS